MPPHHRFTVSPHHCVSQSFALAPATKPVSHLPCPLPPNQSVILLALYHCITASVSHLPCPLPPNQSVIWLALYHCIIASVSHLPCPLPPNQSVIWFVLYHRITASSQYRVTRSLWHCITVSLHQWVICLAPCHQTSQSFALPPATKPVSHLTCPLPPHHCITMSPHHCITASLCHCITTSPHHCITASPCHCVIASSHHHITVSLCHCITTSPHHCITASPCHCIIASSHHHITVSLRHHITASPHHHITTSPHEIFPTTWEWIWLVNTTQHSSDWLIVPTTANQITGIEKPNYHKTLIFFPTTSLKRSHEARIDELADSNEPAIILHTNIL